MKNFEEKLKYTLHQNSIKEDKEHLEEVILLAKKETNKSNRISFLCFLYKQIKYIGWKVWTIQSMTLLIIITILNNIYGEYFLESPRAIIKFLFCISILIEMSSLPLIYRVIRYKMQEVEGATYFSSVKILLAKVLMIGVGDILLLLSVFIATLLKTSLEMETVSLYLLLPFLFITSVCLFMLGHLTAKRFLIGNIGFSSLLIFICTITPGRFDLLYGQSFSMGWLIVCGMLIAFCIWQFNYILYRSPYKELQIDIN